MDDPLRAKETFTRVVTDTGRRRRRGARSSTSSTSPAVSAQTRSPGRPRTPLRRPMAEVAEASAGDVRALAARGRAHYAAGEYAQASLA